MIGADGLSGKCIPRRKKPSVTVRNRWDLAQFQKMMKDLEPCVQLWQESRKKELAAAADS